MKTYDINEAADFLKVDRTTALSLAGAGELPGAKIGRAWVFMESDLVEYLRDKVRRQTDTRREDAAIRRNGAQDVEVKPTSTRGRRRRVPPPTIPAVGTTGATMQAGRKR